MSTVAERVAAGAAWLDEHEPGWAARIDLDTLRLRSPCLCVLGQLFGDFYADEAEAARYNDNGDSVSDLRGFDIAYENADEPDLSFAELDREWHRIIVDRRGGAS